ncbi:hypothetical protein Tco_1055528 [Tanacetum coccineum]|uniref:Integrase, catalytic region, zinc finger, CCHC-type, peptidase aspartic, catalytic n=1 Tax=Tanacetum coccineum TaxID=301880 RepID=A0ABQ5GZW9_9ASTR
MSSMQEDIQCAGSDTRPPMLDRTDFKSWQQRICLYYLGKDNGENIMKSINEGPFHMGTVSDVIAGGTEGAVQQGPVRARVLNDLSAEEKGKLKLDFREPISTSSIPKESTASNQSLWALKVSQTCNQVVLLIDATLECRTTQFKLYPTQSVCCLLNPQKNISDEQLFQLDSGSEPMLVVQDGKVVVQDVPWKITMRDNQGSILEMKHASVEMVYWEC